MYMFLVRFCEVSCASFGGCDVNGRDRTMGWILANFSVALGDWYSRNFYGFSLIFFGGFFLRRFVGVPLLCPCCCPRRSVDVSTTDRRSLISTCQAAGARVIFIRLFWIRWFVDFFEVIYGISCSSFLAVFVAFRGRCQCQLCDSRERRRISCFSDYMSTTRVL